MCSSSQETALCTACACFSRARVRVRVRVILRLRVNPNPIGVRLLLGAADGVPLAGVLERDHLRGIWLGLGLGLG